MPCSSWMRRRLALERLEDRRMLAAFMVTTPSDVVNPSDGLTSLREAINAANAAGGADEIGFAPSLAAATIQLQPGTTLLVTDSVTITGLGADSLTIRGAGKSVFTLNDSGTNLATPRDVIITGLRITGGGGNAGGGIFSRENLTLTDSIVTGNTLDAESPPGGDASGGAGIFAASTPGAVPITTTIVDSEISNNVISIVPDDASPIAGPAGYSGGGVYSSGTLLVIDSVVANNRAGAGGPGAVGGSGGRGGDGGGLYSVGLAVVFESTVIDNRAGSGRNGQANQPASSGGDGGNGGGIAAFGSLSIGGSVVAENGSGAAGQGLMGDNGRGGHGGGVYFDSAAFGGSAGALSVANSTVSANFTAAGVVGNSLSPGSHGGDGGGIWALGQVNVRDAAIFGNATGAGGDGFFSPGLGLGRNGGDGGDGAGVWIGGEGDKTLINVTVSGNATGAGGDDATSAAAGDGGDGAGVWIGGAHAATIAHATIVHNSTGDGGAHVPLGLGGGDSGRGGGVFNAGTAPSAPLYCTIVALNERGTTLPQSNDLAGTGAFATSYSLVGVDPGGVLVDGGGNQKGTIAAPLDPELGPLADNGGATLTHAPLEESPVLDAGETMPIAPYGLLTDYDQRGHPYRRLFGPAMDIGAYEFNVIGGDADFDDDDDVDGRDLLLWQRGLGDADEDGDSDGDDLQVWRDAFGSEATPTSNGAAIDAALESLGIEIDVLALAGIDSPAIEQPAARRRAQSTAPTGGGQVDSVGVTLAAPGILATAVVIDGEPEAPFIRSEKQGELLDAAMEDFGLEVFVLSADAADGRR